MKYIKYILVFISLAFILTGCGISDQAVNRAKMAQSLYKSAEQAYSTKKSKYEALKKTSEFKKLVSYSKKEKWDNEFAIARSYLDKAKQISNSISNILSKDDSDQESTLNRKVIDLKRQISEASKHYNKVMQRINFLTKVMKDAPNIHKKAIEETAKISSIYESLKKHFEKVKKDYPEKTADLDKKLTAVTNIVDESKKLETIVKSEFAQKDIDRNYALLGDSGKAISANLKKIQDMDISLRKKTSELYQSYTKILKDMKIEIYIIVGRASWDNSSDWDNTHNYTYPPKLVDEKTADYFDKIDSAIATYSKGWGGRLSVKVVKSYWDNLKINPDRSWPSSFDDEAEYWIQDIKYKFYHKYIIIENDKSKKTDWVEVPENVFYANEANLGMEIVSKPYGYYESEKIKTAAPPGMSTVGNKKYGEWKTETDPKTGESHTFWHYYGQYRFIGDLIGSNNHYYYDDYNRYNQHKSNHTNYYGSKKQYGTWGSKTHKSKTFSHSRYASKHYSRRASSRSSRTSRSSGSRSRGRGPGGGGK